MAPSALMTRFLGRNALTKQKENMEEVENQGSEIQEVAPPSTESAQEAQPVAQKQEDTSWIKQLRREREEYKKKSQMQEELLRHVLSQQQVSQSPPQQEEDVIDQLSREEYVPGEKVAKAFKGVEAKFERKLQEIENRYQSQAEKNTLSDLKREMSDFDEVVNPETLALLDEIDPRRANALRQTADPYVRWTTTYDIIKARGLVEKAPNARRADEVERKIEQNKKVVQSPQAFDKRPMAKAFDYSRMDKKLQEDLQREMHQFASLAGTVPNLG